MLEGCKNKGSFLVRNGSETHWISTIFGAFPNNLGDMPQVCSWKTWSNLRQVHHVMCREGVEKMIQNRHPNWHRNLFHQPWYLLVRQKRWLDMLLPPNVDAFKILIYIYIYRYVYMLMYFEWSIGMDQFTTNLQTTCLRNRKPSRTPCEKGGFNQWINSRDL